VVCVQLQVLQQSERQQAVLRVLQGLPQLQQLQESWAQWCLVQALGRHLQSTGGSSSCSRMVLVMAQQLQLSVLGQRFLQEQVSKVTPQARTARRLEQRSVEVEVVSGGLQ
jgi:hypothetical protein